MVRNYVRAATAAFLALALGGCLATTGVDNGRDFEESKATQITPGMTQSQVVEVIGSRPVSINKSGGQENWYYQSTAVNENTTAIAGGTIVASTLASSIIGTLVPGAAPFVYLGTAAAGLGVLSAAQRMTVNSKSLHITFENGRVASCTLMVSKTDTKAAGPTSETETTYCGGPAPSNLPMVSSAGRL